MASSIDSASVESDIHEHLVSSDDDNFEEVGSPRSERAREGKGAGEDSAETRRVDINRKIWKVPVRRMMRKLQRLKSQEQGRSHLLFGSMERK